MNQGTNQKDRLNQARALLADYFKMDARNAADLYEETRRVASQLRFFGIDGENENWSAFFEDLGETVFDGSYREGKVKPHLALLVTFLKLFSHAQHDLNSLAFSHLDFFYSQVLGQNALPAISDKVYLFFELSKIVDRLMLEARSRVSAGKDSRGADIIFTNPRPAPLSQARLTQVMSVLNPENPAGQIRSAFTTDVAKVTGGWHPFGDGATASDALTGWAISSPVLLLREGARTIRVTYEVVQSEFPPLLAPDFPLWNAFEVTLTGKQGWVAARLSDKSAKSGSSLTLIVELPETAPAVSCFDPAVHGYGALENDWPMMRFTLKSPTRRAYELLAAVHFIGVHVQVLVKNIAGFALSNDYGTLDTSKVSQPFGYNPVPGANVFLSLEELALKSVEKVEVNFKWKGLPLDFAKYYEGYRGETDSLVQSDADFKIQAEVSSEGEWKSLKSCDGAELIPLFDNSICLDTSLHLTKKSNFPPANRRRDGMLRLSLASPDQAFGHALYPRLIAKASIKQARGSEVNMPNEPYTPALESVRLTYQASDVSAFKNEQDTIRIYHLEPFGIQPVVLNRNTMIPLTLAPDSLKPSGQLFLGIDGIEPPLHLPLFFEIQETAARGKGAVEIHYLSTNGWERFAKDQVLEDQTSGLRQSGVLTLRLPQEMSRANQVMPSGQYWLRFSVQEHAADFDPILAIRLNAVLFERELTDISDDSGLNALPAGAIRNLLASTREIKKISQPYGSFGDRQKETDSDRFIRISELLGHKGRAISSRDFERLVLNTFPQIYKAKCIPHRAAGSRLSRPGCVHVVVIPRILPTADRQKVLRPVAGQSLLDRILHYLNTVKSPQVQVDVTNADFVEVKVVAQLGFRDEGAPGVYVNRLQEELRGFLSPWAFNSNIEIQLGSKLHLSSLTSFIETRPYVEFIEKIGWEIDNAPNDAPEIELDQKSVIVSADRHELIMVTADAVPYQNYRGVGQMIVDINFEVL